LRCTQLQRRIKAHGYLYLLSEFRAARQGGCESVIYTESASSENIEAVNRVLQYRFHKAFKSNFKADAGLFALESNVVRELEAVTASWARVQMLERVSDRKAVQPINPFAQSQ
jgi:hypothetical protein